MYYNILYCVVCDFGAKGFWPSVIEWSVSQSTFGFTNVVPSTKLLLGGSWVVISGVIRDLIWILTIVTLLITPLITTHEPPSRPKPDTLIESLYRSL